MIVTCESCKTKFHLDPLRLKGPRSRVRCSQCGHIFSVDQVDEEVLIHVDLPEDEELEESDLEFASSLESPAVPLREAPRRRNMLLAIGGAALLLLGAVLFWFVDRMTSAPPDIGGVKVPAQSEMPTVTILESTQAYFLENPQAGGQIFVIEGEVSNESGKLVSFVLLEGRLYSVNNQVAQSQRCYAGNVMSRNELTKLSVNEIQNRMMNREGKDLSNVRIPPSRRVPFMLVFHNLPEFGALSDYSVELVSAKTD
ncbi:MAG: DUF3426 domain-containing protein [Deltaproteobacteria bacterium]|nr:DUF3426 domain-containing protein [Deltaproteobacteria bacterium]